MKRLGTPGEKFNHITGSISAEKMNFGGNLIWLFEKAFQKVDLKIELKFDAWSAQDSSWLKVAQEIRV